MTDKYTALLGKLKEATGPFEFNKAIGLAWGIYPNEDVDDDRVVWLELALRGSLSAIGAALALVEMELPGWELGFYKMRTGHTKVELRRWTDIPPFKYAGVGHVEAPTPTLAILIAWCEAMIAKETSNGDA